MNRVNNIFNENEIDNKLRDFKEGKDYSVSPTGDGKWFYNFFSNELRNFWGNDRILVNRVVETDSNKNYDYYGRFETYQDGGHLSYQSWIGKPSEKLNTGKVIDELNFSPSLSKYLKDSWRDAKKIESVSGNINDLEWMKQVGERNWPSSLSENKNELSPSQQEKSLEKLGISNNSQELIIKENQELKQQLFEVQQQLVKVSEELKKLKDSLTDKDKEELAKEFIEIQEQNDKLVGNPNASAAEIKEHTVKVEDLGKKVNARNVNTETFSTNSPDGKDNSNLLIGGGVALISILTVSFGYYLVKKKKNK